MDLTSSIVKPKKKKKQILEIMSSNPLIVEMKKLIFKGYKVVYPNYLSFKKLFNEIKNSALQFSSSRSHYHLSLCWHFC